MPIYPYRCPACGAEFEVSRRLKDRHQPVMCPADGAESTRLLTAPSLLGSARQESSAPAASPAKPAGGWSHFGHSHGAGASGHSHGAPRPTSGTSGDVSPSGPAG